MNNLNNEHRVRAIRGRDITDDLKTILALIQKTQQYSNMLLIYSQDPENTAHRFEQLGGVCSMDDQGRVVVDWKGFHMTFIPIAKGEKA